MNELSNTLKKVINNINAAVELFYTQKEIQGYNKVNETINDISRTMELLLSRVEGEQIPDNYMEIIKYLQESLSAIETKDTILLADILQYEIKERFEIILREVGL